MAISENILLNARDNTKQAWDSVSRSSKQASNQIIDNWKAASRGMTVAGTALTALGAVSSAFIIQSTSLAARVETLGTVMFNMGQQAGYTNEQLSEFEESIKSQGITTQVARESIVRLMRANIDLAEASKIARLAQDAAVIAGINSSEAFDRVVEAIDKMDVQMLRTMGIVIDMQGATKAYAEEQGIATTEVSKAAQQQLFFEAVMEKGIGIAGSYETAMGTVGKSVTSLPRYYEELQLSIGNVFIPAMETAVQGATNLLKAFDALSEGQKRFIALGLGGVAAGATLGGPLLIMAAQLPTIITMLAGVGSALAFNSTAFTGFALRVMGATSVLGPFAEMLGLATAGALGLTLALAGLTLGIGAFIVYMGAGKIAFEDLATSLADAEQTAFDSANSFEEYNRLLDAIPIKSRFAAIELEKLRRTEDVFSRQLRSRTGVGPQGAANPEVAYLRAVSDELDVFSDRINKADRTIDLGRLVTGRPQLRDPERGRVADAERLNALASDYARITDEQIRGIERGRDAEAERYASLAGFITGTTRLEQVRNAESERWAGIADLFIEKEERIVSTTEDVAKGFVGITSIIEEGEDAAADFFDGINTGLAGMVENWIESLAFVAMGGGEYQRIAEAIHLALNETQITPEQAEQMFVELYPELFEFETAWQVTQGNLTFNEAAVRIRDELNIPLGEAQTLLKDIIDQGAQIDGSHWQAILDLNVRANAPGWVAEAARLQGLADFYQNRAVGGDVFTGRGFVVGERGPEVFIPRTDGEIMTQTQYQRALQQAAAQGGGAGVDITQLVDEMRGMRNDMGLMVGEMSSLLTSAAAKGSAM